MGFNISHSKKTSDLEKRVQQTHCQIRTEYGKLKRHITKFLQGLKSVNMTEATVKSQNMQSA
ncbi:hypothetical protein DWY44_10115 [Ruminococcus sp. AF25-19]|nr:hypothetical protein DWY44_10115 [Ruminococcus sp. AF25-19]